MQPSSTYAPHTRALSQYYNKLTYFDTQIIHLGVFECTLAVSLIDACVDDWESGKRETSPICITRAVSIFERWGSILEPADWEVLGSKMLPLLDHPSNGICEAALRFCEAALPTHIQHYTVIPLYRVPPPSSPPQIQHPHPMLM